jgi:hypothetical protein
VLRREDDEPQRLIHDYVRTYSTLAPAGCRGMFSCATAHSASRTGAAHVTSGRAASPTARVSESSSGAVCRCCAERCRGSPESHVGDADAGLELEHERVTAMLARMMAS